MIRSIQLQYNVEDQLKIRAVARKYTYCRLRLQKRCADLSEQRIRRRQQPSAGETVRPTALHSTYQQPPQQQQQRQQHADSDGNRAVRCGWRHARQVQKNTEMKKIRLRTMRAA